MWLQLQWLRLQLFPCQLTHNVKQAWRQVEYLGRLMLLVLLERLLGHMHREVLQQQGQEQQIQQRLQQQQMQETQHLYLPL